MVFFNYSTMQMAAKVVYYGPGLCGKTTNLHFIYGHTTSDSRGEMVSLETETDRTLFFDLLPLDVGSIAGFNTRIQLYTVPGQVFYNTTRKLVLKGVDGVVFVVDSQRAMLQANQESFRNLEENLAEMGLSIDGLPLVLQYNKRDLAEIYSVDELNQAINRQNWPWFEASAVSGQGVFETLKGISKYTLLALKKRLGRSGTESTSGSRLPPPTATGANRPPAAAASGGFPAAGAPAAAAAVGARSAAAPPPPAAVAAMATMAAAAAAPAATPAGGPAANAATWGSAAAAAPLLQPLPPMPPLPPLQPLAATPLPAPPAAFAADLASGAHRRADLPSGAHRLADLPTGQRTVDPLPAPGARPAGRNLTGRSRSVDVLSELEKLRREAMQPTQQSASGAHARAAQPPAAAVLPPQLAAAAIAAKAAGNGRAELSRSIEMTLKRADFVRARRFLVSFQVEDDQHRIVDSVRDLQVEIKDNADASVEKLLLRLNIALHAKE